MLQTNTVVVPTRVPRHFHSNTPFLIIKDKLHLTFSNRVSILFHNLAWKSVAKSCLFSLEQGQVPRHSAAHPHPKLRRGSRILLGFNPVSDVRMNCYGVQVPPECFEIWNFENPIPWAFHCTKKIIKIVTKSKAWCNDQSLSFLLVVNQEQLGL